MRVISTLALLLVLLVASQRAEAYPQFLLAHDQTCTSCHISPDGSGVLNENGLNTAQALGWKDHAPDFLYKKVSTPDWLQLGGDEQGALGVVRADSLVAAGFPMQLEVDGRAHYGAFSVVADASFREPGGNTSRTPVHFLWSRQHYVMWKQKPDDNEGLYVRVGHFSPTFGLRLAEHVAYTQRYGGHTIFDETYAASVAYVKNSYEVHVTGFIPDKIFHSPEHGNGVALYAEKRLGEHAAVGLEYKYSKSDDEKLLYGGVTGKYYLTGPEVLLLGEAEVIRDDIEVPGAGDRATRVATYAMGSHQMSHNLMVDIGAGHYVQDTRVKGLFRDCVDANVHWFYDSHLEFMLTNRFELTDGFGGRKGGYALAQLHLRL